jgi:hypothetical protein
MKIKNLFEKDLFRPINGVVKADQQEDSVVFQELDEYVITQELDKHLRKFIEAFLTAKDNQGNPALTDQMGVWVSGFFGSGKSHFIKIISYLMNNRTVQNPDTKEEKFAIDLLDAKFNDPMLVGDIKRAVGKDTDVILFNIDSKADAKDGRDAILKVFMRVFNELQGFCGDHPHIAEMERYLESKNLYYKFQEAFKVIHGSDWKKERDSYLLMRDEVILALAQALNKSEKSAIEWFEQAEKKYTLNIEKFGTEVKNYLDAKGTDARIIFLVDEIGQFIGDDTHLMLNLQTITEDLGRICKGRAWVVVTSQEDIDAVLGEIRGTQANDFSKIQGRFTTRLSLSSTNTDEVIQSRLLYKNEDAHRALEDLFNEKGEIIKSQATFTGGATLKNYKDKNDFIKCYPFAPYHFQLVQKIFESIRRAGATGLHLSRGERSMLDAFQLAAKNISEDSIGAFVPLYEFYPSIESFLDTAVKRTIDQSKDNAGLKPFDTQVLKVLFLIRYLDVLKSNVDNLVTLCVDEIDADRLGLRKKIEESLQRMEKETLINRNGDLYFFLTNEERDVSREIKKMDISPAEEIKLLSELVFDEVLKGDNKHRYQINKKDYGYNRLCDGHVYGSNVQQELTVEIVSPFSEDYSLYTDAKCIGQSTEGGGRVFLKLEDNKALGLELRALLQADKYIRLKSDAAASSSLKRILSDRAEENRDRRKRLISLLERLVLEADFYAIGETHETKANSARPAIGEALNYLIANAYTKLGYLKTVQGEPQKEIKSVLLKDEVGQHNLDFDETEPNAQALKEIAKHIELANMQSHKILMNKLVEKFSKRPYGWPEWEIVFLTARLFMAGEVVFMIEGDTVKPREAIDFLSKQVKWKQVKIIKRKAIETEALKKAKEIGQALFGKIGPDAEEGLFLFLKEHLAEWKKQLEGFQYLTDTGKYPGKKETDHGCLQLGKLLDLPGSYQFIDSFNIQENDLKALSEDVHKLADFFTHQRNVWEKLQNSMERLFQPNREELEKDGTTLPTLQRMDQILSAPSPYGMLKEVTPLVNTVKAVNDRIVGEARERATIQVDQGIFKIKEILTDAGASDDLSNQVLKPLQDLKGKISEEISIPNIYYQQQKLNELMSIALRLIEKKGVKPGEPPPKPPLRFQPSIYAEKLYIENETDIEEFVQRLKKELLAVLKENPKIRIE